MLSNGEKSSVVEQLFDVFVEALCEVYESHIPHMHHQIYIFPAFVKPSAGRGAVTGRQCCLVRFWHPDHIPAHVTNSQKEALQLHSFPLFPSSLNWAEATGSKAEAPGRLHSCLNVVARSMGNTGNWINRSYHTFGTYGRYLTLADMSIMGDTLTNCAQAFLGSYFMQKENHQASHQFKYGEDGKIDFLKWWELGNLPQLPSSAATCAAAELLHLKPGIVSSSVRALGHLGECLIKYKVIPPLENYNEAFGIAGYDLQGKRIVSSQRKRPKVSYFLYKALSKVPPPYGYNMVAASVESNDISPQAKAVDDYLKQVFDPLSKDQADELRSVLYCGSTFWISMHNDFRSSRQALQDTSQVTNWIASSPFAMAKLASFNIRLYDEETGSSSRICQEGDEEESRDQPGGRPDHDAPPLSVAAIIKAPGMKKQVVGSKRNRGSSAAAAAVTELEGSVNTEGSSTTTTKSVVSNCYWAWSVDHIVPRRLQGQDHWRNYCLMPQRVNSQFRERDMTAEGIQKSRIVGEPAYEAAQDFHKQLLKLYLG